MPITPAPNRTRRTVRDILQIELKTVILGNDCVSREDISAERNIAYTEDTPNRRIDTRIRSNPIVAGKIMCSKTKTVKLHATIAKHKRNSDAFISTLVSPFSPSEKLLPRKRVLPLEMPRSTSVVKMILREITVEETPITSRGTILDRINQRKYPTIIVIMLSRKRYVAPLPTNCFFSSLHRSS
jgi:hypothetical protein